MEKWRKYRTDAKRISKTDTYPGNAACVRIEHVTKCFGEDLVLKEVNLTLDYGQVYGIVGNNGSGKTVLMKCICGFLPATTGTIRESGNPGRYEWQDLQSRYPAGSEKGGIGSGYEKACWKIFPWNAPAPWDCAGHYGGSKVPHFGRAF